MKNDFFISERVQMSKGLIPFIQMKNFFNQLLRKTQKYTGTDNVYLLRGGFWLTLGQAVSTAAAFLLAWAFANLLDPATYGYYKYILSLLGMLGILSLIGVRKAATQAVARGLEGSFYSGFITRLKWGTLASLAAAGGAVYYLLQGNKFLSIPLLISAVFLPLMNASQIYTSFLEGKKLFNILTKYSIIVQITLAAAMIIALLIAKNLLWLIAIYLVFHTFLNYFLYALTKIKFQPNKNEDPKTISYGKHLSLMGVISQTAAYIDKILLFNFLGPAQLAVYSFAMLLPEQIQNVLRSITTLALPKLAPKSREEIKVNIMKKAGKLFLLTAAVMILYVTIAPYFYRIFFPQYLESVLYSQLFILSFISIPAGLLGTVFEAKMMKKELYLIKIAPLAHIALMSLLIPFYGIWGAIMAAIGAQAFKFGLVLFLFRKF